MKAHSHNRLIPVLETRSFTSPSCTSITFAQFSSPEMVVAAYGSLRTTAAPYAMTGATQDPADSHRPDQATQLFRRFNQSGSGRRGLHLMHVILMILGGGIAAHWIGWATAGIGVLLGIVIGVWGLTRLTGAWDPERARDEVVALGTALEQLRAQVDEASRSLPGQAGAAAQESQDDVQSHE
jgi:hypothetical protein